MSTVLDFASKALEYHPPSQTFVAEELQSIIDSKCRMDDPNNDFRSMKFLGRGATSQVYEAIRVMDGKRVAVKVIERTDKTKTGRVLNEIAMMHLLKEHPNVVTVIDTYFVDSSVWMSMEYVRTFFRIC